MSSFKTIPKHFTEIRFNKIESSVFTNGSHFFSEMNTHLLHEDNDTNFLMCKCVALEDLNLDIEVNEIQYENISKKEICNYICNYNKGIRRTFNKQSKRLLNTIPEFHLE